MRLRDKLLSVVVPAYCEEEGLAEMMRQLHEVLENCADRWEVIFVDDGSDDDTWSVIRQLHQQYGEHVNGLRLSRNFGHQNALFAGLEAARGDAVISMDADLQHPPELIPELLACWREGYDIVNTLRTYPPETSWLKRKSSDWYYRFFSFMSGVELKPGKADFRLMDAKVVRQLTQFQENGLFIRGLVEWVGFESTEIPYEARKRHAGTSKYGLRKMLRLAVAGMTSFSTVPLRMAIFLGFATAGLAFLELVYVVISKLAGNTVPGWASAVGIISFLFGILFVLLGVLGEYLSKVLEQVQLRPRYIVDQQVGLEKKDVSHE